MGTDSEFMKTAGFSAFLGIPEETVRHWHKVGIGPDSVKVGRHRLYRRADRGVARGAARGRAGADGVSGNGIGSATQGRADAFMSTDRPPLEGPLWPACPIHRPSSTVD